MGTCFSDGSLIIVTRVISEDMFEFYVMSSLWHKESKDQDLLLGSEGETTSQPLSLPSFMLVAISDADADHFVSGTCIRSHPTRRRPPAKRTSPPEKRQLLPYEPNVNIEHLQLLPYVASGVF